MVGYMGDGINDAPSLHSADVGISVDQAVDVAKQAADLVLLEHDLTVLRRGIELGRTTFANTMKYIFVTTSANFGNMFSMAGASLLLKFLPLLPAQILLTNFLTDFPAMTIASDNVDRELIAKPQRWNIRFLRDFMFTFGTISSVFDYLTFGLLLLVLNASQDEFRTAWFLVSVLTELLIMLVIRTRKPFFRSRPGKYLLISTVLVAGVTLILPYSPLSSLLGFTPLSLPAAPRVGRHSRALHSCIRGDKTGILQAGTASSVERLADSPIRREGLVARRSWEGERYPVQAI